MPVLWAVSEVEDQADGVTEEFVTPKSGIQLEYAGAQTHSPIEDESRPGLGSLVLSLFFFVPFVTAVMAIILGCTL